MSAEDWMKGLRPPTRDINKRLLRHRCKMQRRYEERFSAEAYEARRKEFGNMAFWYTPAEPGTLIYRLHRPDMKPPIVLWFESQREAIFAKTLVMPGKWWCNTHERWATFQIKGEPVRCAPWQAGIMFSCSCVDVEGIVEIREDYSGKPGVRFDLPSTVELLEKYE